MKFRRMPPVLVAVAIVAVSAVTVPQGSQAEAQPQAPGIVVDSVEQAASWDSSVQRYGQRVRDVPQCRQAYCDSAQISVQLPANAWKRDGGLQIAIKWDADSGAALGLFVYRNGELVASSESDMGSARSVTIPRARNGEYDVYVAYGTARGGRIADREIPYQARAEVEYKPRAEPARDLLPDLVSLPQENVTYARPGRFFDDYPVRGSCFYSEFHEEGAEQCLRFDQLLYNDGAGPLEIRFDRQAGTIGNEDVVQRIYKSNGKHRAASAGQVEFHGIHSHYHLEGFAQSKLWRLKANGEFADDKPAAVGDKVSFCITDTDLVDFDGRGDAPLTYPASDCSQPKKTEDGVEYFWYGLSPGWADRYAWDLPDQMIDTTGLADGTYALLTTVDPDEKITEIDESNNCRSVVVELSELTTHRPQARLVGGGPDCS